MSAQRNWYGRDWRILRNNLVQHCVNCSNELLQALSDDSVTLSSFFSEYWDKLLSLTAKRIETDQVGLWEHALALLSDEKPLLDRLNNARGTFSISNTAQQRAVSPRQAFGQIVRQYLENARRDMRAVEMGVSNNKVKTWERLDRISRESAVEDGIDNRCSDEHFYKLSELVKSKYPNDKNLPRSVSTIGDYFYRFSDDCIFVSSDAVDGVIGKQEATAEQLFGNQEIHALEECISELTTKERALLCKRYDLGLIDQVVSPPGPDAKLTLSQEDAQVSWEAILKKLRICLESRASVWINGV